MMQEVSALTKEADYRSSLDPHADLCAYASPEVQTCPWLTHFWIRNIFRLRVQERSALPFKFIQTSLQE
jgi:hypothetical protein